MPLVFAVDLAEVLAGAEPLAALVDAAPPEGALGMAVEGAPPAADGVPSMLAVFFAPGFAFGSTSAGTAGALFALGAAGALATGGSALTLG